MSIQQVALLCQNRDKLRPCTHCGCSDFEIKQAINSNGQDCYPYFCCACGSRSPIVEKKAVAKKMGIL